VLVAGHGAQLAGDAVEQRVGAGRLVPLLKIRLILAQGLKNGVQRGRIADVEAGPGQHGVTRVTHRAGGLAQQSALADAALAGDEHRGRATRADVAQVGLDIGKRVGAPDKRTVVPLVAGHAGQPNANRPSTLSSVRSVLRHKNDGSPGCQRYVVLTIQKWTAAGTVLPGASDLGE
jgi:hypothetical protein